MFAPLETSPSYDPSHNFYDASKALEFLTTSLEEDLQRVNALILEKSLSSVDLISTLAQHLISAGGKRLRPLLTLAAARIFNYEGHNHIRLATAIEFIHTATLLHDDVVDQSALRRGQKSANALWGNAPSVLVGDFLFSQAFGLMVETGSLEALEILSKASSVIAQGEVRQLLAAHELEISFGDYIETITAKTASLFQAACEVGAVLTPQEAWVRKTLRDFGYHLGLVFQLQDDVLDYFGASETMGKALGNDFREGKVTLPLILTYENASLQEKDYIKKLFQARSLEGGAGDEAFFNLSQIMWKKEIPNRCATLVEGHGQKAREALRMLVPMDSGSWIPLLRNVVDYCVLRRN